MSFSMPPAAVPPESIGRRRGPYAAANARREAIVKAAVDHFGLWGYHAASLPKIAAEAGISQAGLLHHFPSKERLLLSVLESRDEDTILRFFSDGVQGPDDIVGRLVDVVEYNAARPALLRMYVVLSAEAGDPSHPAHAYFTERYEQVLTALETALRTAVAAGTVHADTDPAVLAGEIAAVSDGLQIQWGLARPGWEMTPALRGYLDRLSRAITTDGRGLGG
jgi:AcrR family transcriptional regulator